MEKQRPYQFFFLLEALKIASAYFDLHRPASVKVFMYLLNHRNGLQLGIFDWAVEVERESDQIVVPGFITAIVKSYAEHLLSDVYDDSASQIVGTYEKKFHKAKNNAESIISMNEYRELATVSVCLIEKTDAADSEDLREVRSWFQDLGKDEDDKPTKLQECKIELESRHIASGVTDCSFFGGGGGVLRLPNGEDPLEAVRKEVESMPQGIGLIDDWSDPKSRNYLSQIIFRYAAYKLIIDRERELGSPPKEKRIRAVVEKLYHFATFKNIPNHVLDWTFRIDFPDCIDGLLTAVAAWVGIYFSGETTMVEEGLLIEKLSELNDKISRASAVSLRAKEFVCMFGKAKFDSENYIQYFNLGMKHLFSGEDGSEDDDEMRNYQFDKCVKWRSKYYDS